MNWGVFFAALVGFACISFGLALIVALLDRIERRYSFTAALCTGLVLAALAAATIAGVLTA